ncbi:tRNA glutamyl-Q(34) synthetase GluQRS [Myxococcota bacterium]|nr:tRNA glutamyl-Q(34) synthetase GluQRS [Myxococcota bacterium]
MSLRGAGRFAPTPTGRLHLGNVRTALLAWLWARSAGLPNVLRIEDLDPAAVPAGAIEAIYADLDWLGLCYDEEPRSGGPVGPYRQSERFALYAPPLAALAAEGLLYACDCSRREVALAALAPHAGDEGPAYPGTCRPPRPAALDIRSAITSARGRPCALRLDVRAALERLGVRDIAFDDRVRGRVCMGPDDGLFDFVVRRTDGQAAYQLACAFDDVAMGCSQVLRGVDLVTSAVRQVLLLRLLGLPEPQYAHVGLVVDSDGQKLSKRDDAIALSALRARGLPAEQVIATLASLCGLPATADLDALCFALIVGPGLADSVRLPPGGLSP